MSIQEQREEIEQLKYSKGWQIIKEKIEEEQRELKDGVFMSDFMEEEEKRLAMKKQALYNAFEVVKDYPEEILRQLKINEEIKKEGGQEAQI